MKEIKTAEEFFKEKYGSNDRIAIDNAILLSKEFAKIHVEAALEAADEKATVTPIDHEEISESSWRPIWGVDSDSILNAYPLNNIK